MLWEQGQPQPGSSATEINQLISICSSEDLNGNADGRLQPPQPSGYGPARGPRVRAIADPYAIHADDDAQVLEPIIVQTGAMPLPIAIHSETASGAGSVSGIEDTACTIDLSGEVTTMQTDLGPIATSFGPAKAALPFRRSVKGIAPNRSRSRAGRSRSPAPTESREVFQAASEISRDN